VNRTVDRDSNQDRPLSSSDHSDECFIELCALSTTGILSTTEWNKLEAHLSQCASCREIKNQYDKIIVTTLPAMAANRALGDDGQTPDSWSIERAEASLMERIERENIVPERGPQPSTAPSSKRRPPWTYAAAAIFLGISACAGYQLGVFHGRGLSSATPRATLQAPHDQFVREEVRAAPPDVRQEADRQAAAKVIELRRQLEASLSNVARLEERQKSLEGRLAQRNASLEYETQERTHLEQQLVLVQSNARSLQDKLRLAAAQVPRATTPTETLQTRVGQLTALTQEKDQEIARGEELLQHDRDIRNLIGARDLYIAEIYDVDKTGRPQKPFGRVFYTKGKSLVFYAYDLDQQPGVKLARTFQAWGRKGVDQQHDINLGIFYQDVQDTKRWILKSNDPVTLAQLDAVFVTVEPHGESSKPTGKPLLFAYLRLTPNHP
jgi:hypothetical protein